MKKISVVVIEGHQLLRELLVDLFEQNEKYKVIGQSGSYQEAKEIIGVMQPDVVLLDLNLPDCSGLHLILSFGKYLKKQKS